MINECMRECVYVNVYCKSLHTSVYYSNSIQIFHSHSVAVTMRRYHVYMVCTSTYIYMQIYTYQYVASNNLKY